MTTKNTRTRLLAFLTEVDTKNLSHTGRSLLDHLLGTHDLLKEWGCDEPICIAGGLHSVYGTNVFIKESLSIESRPIVRARFGNDAERLAWLFGTLNRPKAIEYGFGIDRRNNVSVEITEPDLRSLRLIEAANLLEQGATLERWPNILNAAEKQIHG